MKKEKRKKKKRDRENKIVPLALEACTISRRNDGGFDSVAADAILQII